MNFSDYFRILFKVVRVKEMFRKIKNKVKAFFSLTDDISKMEDNISKMKANMSKMEKDIIRILKIGGVIFITGIFIVALVLVLIVANSFYIHTINTRLDKIENTQARFETDITLKLDQLLAKENNNRKAAIFIPSSEESQDRKPESVSRSISSSKK